MLHRALLLSFVAFGVSLPSAGADEVAPAPERHLRDTVALSMNNIGLQNALDFSRTWPISKSSSALRRDAHVSVGLSNLMTPSHARLGGWAELAPLSIVGLRVGAEPAVYYGTFASLMSFQDYGDDFSNDARKARKDEAAFGTAARVYASPTLRAKAGAIMATAGADFEWWWSSASGPLFYEPARDTLLATSAGRMVNVSALVLYGRSERLMPGLNYGFASVPGAPQNQIQRVGAVVISKVGGRAKPKRLAANVFYYLSDPSKRHQLGATLALVVDSAR
jgi:hypothetical protein